MLDRVEVFGYRRLLNASAYVGRKTVALVGPNEAGKSSVLSALRLFDTNDPVPSIDSTRSLRGENLDPDRSVVRLSFTLDQAQRERVGSLPIEGRSLRHLVFTKHADGRRTYSFVPTPVVSPAVLDDFLDSWEVLIPLLFTDSSDEDQDDEFSSDLEGIRRFVDIEDEEAPDVEVWSRVKSLVDRIPRDDVKVAEAITAFETYYEWGNQAST